MRLNGCIMNEPSSVVALNGSNHNACCKEQSIMADSKSSDRHITRQGRIRDVSGQKFGLLTAIRIVGADKFKRKLWLCQCDCGGTSVVMIGQLGITQSCGCLRRKTKHGMWDTRVYRIWSKMLSRCRDANNTNFRNYGGRGISVCERWYDFESFYSDMGDPPHRGSIDRIDSNGNYEPGNCRWSNFHDQSRNKRTTVNLTYRGVTMCLKDWADKLGLSVPAFRKRIIKWGHCDRSFAPKA